jgi:predicted NUDIX family NTP pyrophosphohydrolase
MAKQETCRTRISAGLLMYHVGSDGIEVLLAHPGGPFFKNRDEGAWSIPKGEPDADEDLLATAQREFEEETAIKPAGPFIPLTPITQKGGKIVHAWAFSGDCDPTQIKSNTFTMEWPPKSGRQMEFPEIDRAEFFALAAAKKKIKAGQEKLLDELESLLGRGDST